MGAAWVDHPSFELVESASQMAQRDVAALLLDADFETLTETSAAQLATFVTSLVVLDAVERLGLEPAACAGHSLGEYTALVASGAVGYEDGLRLVAERGEAMQDAADNAAGTMAAVLGLADDDVLAACERAEAEVWVANYNAPGQVAIAGSPEGVEAAGAIAKSLGAKKVVALPVGGAFHTPFMAPARDRLRKALMHVAFHRPDPVVVANVDARPHPDQEEWRQLLSAQLCAPVRWRQTLEQLYGSGMRTFVELGPGGVLTGLARRALPSEEIAAVSVAVPSDLDKLLEVVAGIEPAPAAAGAPQGERLSMSERLVVSPATGLFQPVPALDGSLPGSEGPGDVSPQLGVGDLVGHVGETEIRSAWAGALAGILVLPGERVAAGQPVAWVRTGTAEVER